MTTQSWSTVIDHSSDAGFRAWVAEMIARITAVGLVQTTDTGQINTVTVTRPGTNSNGGYAIFRMNDTLQGTAPVFFRFDFGTGGSATTPRIQITHGTSSNGSGTIGGTALSIARTCVSNSPPTSTAIAYQSYMCATEGFFGFAWKIGGSTANVPMGCLLYCRSHDATGAPDATGGFVFWAAGSSTSYTAYQFFRYAATAAAYTARSSTAELPFVIPGEPTSSLDAAGNNQAYLWWMAVPDVVPVIGWVQIVRAEAGIGSTFSLIPLGAASRTYIPIGQAFAGSPSSSTAYGPAMLWE